jgi:non-specific serine/threonine protein kinase
MKESPHLRVAALFDELIDLPVVDRTARLNGLTSLDPTTVSQLRAMFGTAAAAGDFLGAVLPPSATNGGMEVEPAPGDSIGPYRLIRRLGAGGTGVVWLAHDPRLDRSVALKLFRGRDAAAAARMRDEARLAARLDHPHVAIVHEIGVTDGGAPFIAMAWSTAGSFADRIAAGPVSLGFVLDVAIQAAQALAAAHSAGIVHRDVKPANLLLHDEVHVRLSDFGAAQWSHRADDEVPAVGTLRFLAPEQLRSAGVDHRSDLWALGVTLYQAVTGRLPFDGGSAGAVLYDVVESDPTPPGRLATIPARLDRLILDLLRKDPAERPETAAQVAAQLADIRAGVRAREGVARPPAPAAPLIGRASEVTQVLALLGERRLVTLTGPGGTGKTRLALEIAARVESEDGGGCCVVELASVRDDAQLPSVIAQALGVSEGGASGVMEQLLCACRGVDRLLMLDNCEHLPSVGELVTTLLHAVPELRVLATSRSPLGVAGEREFPVSPLGLPAAHAAAERVHAAPAVALLVERIRDRDPHFVVTDQNAAPLAAICHRLDGLPLAIELAAARVRTLGCQAVAERLADSTTWLHATLDQRPARHQTLDAAIAWSYALLDDDEQRLFRHLAPFAGGFDLAAVTAVVTSLGISRASDEMLESLIDKSLVIPARPLAGMAQCTQLMTIRAYAAARLCDVGEDHAARTLHARHYLARATEAAARMYGADEAVSHARLRVDQANLRDAFEWWIATGEFVRAAELAVALHRHWVLSGRFIRDIVAQLEQVDRGLAAITPPPIALHANLVKVLGSMSGLAGAHQRIPSGHFARAHVMYRAAGDPHGEALTLNHLGWSSLLLGEYTLAEQHSSMARELHAGIANPAGVAVSRINLGWVALMQADVDAAADHFRVALEILEARGDRRATAYANSHLGTVALRRGDAVTALRRYEHECMAAIAQLGDRVAGPTFELRKAVALHALRRDLPLLTRVRDTLLPQLREASHAWSLAFALTVLGRVLIDQDDPVDAIRYLAEAEQVTDVAGLVSLGTECRMLHAEACFRAGRREAALPLLAASLAVRRRIGEPLGVIEAAELAAEVAVAGGHDERALTYLAASTAVRGALGTARLPRSADRVDAVATRVRAAIPADVALRAQQRGASLTWQELGDQVLSVVA